MMNSRPSFDYAQGRLSTTVGMILLFEIGVCQENLGRPKGALQIPPLRYASVGMTKGRVALSSRFDAADDEQQVLHYGLDGASI